MHEPCECTEPTGQCPRFGYMKGRRWQICQGQRVKPAEREAYLDLYLERKDNAAVPPLAQRVVNLAEAIVKHVGDGLTAVSKEAYMQRLEICSSCDMLNGDGSCRLCGCPVEKKAAMRSETCPAAKWPGDTKRGCGCGR